MKAAGVLARRRRMRNLGLASLLTIACTEPPRPRDTATQEREVVETSYLGEWWSVGQHARCRLVRAEHELSEPQALDTSAQRVLPDLKVLTVHSACQGPTGQAVTLESALPPDTLIFLRDESGRRAPSLRTKLSTLTAPPLVFELADGDQRLPARRIFDAKTGAPQFQENPRVGRVSFEAHGERREVVLRVRALDARLDAWLTHFLRSLSGPGTGAGGLEPAELARIRPIYQGLLERFEPQRARLSELTTNPDGALGLTLVLERPREPDAPNPVARFQLELAPNPTGELGQARLLELADSRAALACAEEERSLRGRFKSESAQPGQGHCHVLGMVVPERCERMSPELKHEILAHRSRCVPQVAALSEATPRPAPIPADFLVTLRRGRRPGGFDHSARYVLAVYGNGSLVFHGKSFVQGTGRSDGRTSERLLQHLRARLVALDWFGRRGGVWNAEGCSPEDDRGDLFTAQLDGKQRMVLDRDGCRGPFGAQELNELQRLLELIAGITSFTRGDGRGSAELGVSEWTVNAD